MYLNILVEFPNIQKALIYRHINAFKLNSNLFLWSWRDSNPRPNEEIIRFLHAYLRLHFRV